jgi:hypothetical protein
MVFLLTSKRVHHAIFAANVGSSACGVGRSGLGAGW